MKNLIINADDFGLSRSVNRGIVESFQSGIVTSASLMVNMPGFDDALSLIKENPALSVGLHINLLRGQPVSSADKPMSLIQNNFFRGSVLSFLRSLHSEGMKEIEKECRAQVEKALRNKLHITHLDSEKNIHMVPKVFKLFVKIAHDYQIGSVRNINECGPYSFSERYFIAKYFSSVSQENRNFSKQYNVKMPDHFFGFIEGAGMTMEALEKTFKCLRKGTTEMVCHPGYIDDEWKKWPLQKERYYINNKREMELEALISPRLKELVKSLGINLISYGEL